MSDTKTLEELVELGNSVSIKELRTMVESGDALAGQLSFTMPAEALINEHDMSLMRKGKRCLLWGNDPNNGSICLKWED